jgi:hypothetical protein
MVSSSVMWMFLPLVAPCLSETQISATRLYFQLTRLSSLFEYPNNNKPFLSSLVYFYRMLMTISFLFTPKFSALFDFIHIQFSSRSCINFLFFGGSWSRFSSMSKYGCLFSFMTMHFHHPAIMFSL